MAIQQPGSFGRVRIFNDFLGSSVDETPTTTFKNLAGNLASISVSSANTTLAGVVDEPGGILSIQTHTDDNDNCAIFGGVFKAADGGCVMEARLKVAAITTSAIFVGFSETLAVTTPVMPAEFDTITLDFVATGNVCGLLHDADATTDDWRAVFGNDNVVITAADANGTRAYEAPVNDEWDVIRVEIGADGDAYVYLNGGLIKKVNDAVTTTDIVHAVVMVENRSGAANTLEVDYFYAEGGRDWTDT